MKRKMAAARTRARADEALQKAFELQQAGYLSESKSIYKRMLRNEPDNHVAMHHLGILYERMGDVAEAEKLLRRAASIDPGNVTYLLNLGVVLKRSGKVSAAIEYYEQALSRDGNNVEALNNMGSALQQMGRLEEAVEHFQKALALRHDHFPSRLNLGTSLHALGRLEEAERELAKAILAAPQDPDGHVNRALVLRGQERLDDAETALREALRLDPQHPSAHNTLGLVYVARGDPENARACFEAALRIRPGYSIARANLATALAQSGRTSDAIECFQEALALLPDDLHVMINLGNTLRAAGRIDESMQLLEQAVKTNPGSSLARNSLGVTLLAGGFHVKARHQFEKSIEVHPEDASAHNNLGNYHRVAGDPDRAIACFRRAVELNPGHVAAYSNLLLCLNYVAYVSSSGLRAEHLRFAEIFEAGLRHHWLPHANSPAPARKLKIGYVSGDFCAHAVSFFTLPVVSQHDRTRFEIHCFHTGKQDDSVTRRFRDDSDFWHPISGLSDDKAADLVRELAVDILVDLSGHTALNRLMLFARKPAPVQVHWLGYITTTGLDSIDYRLTDERVDPSPDSDCNYSERLVRLPIVCAFEPPADCPPVSLLPSLSGGAFTFACLNDASKITPDVVQTWARILAEVPDSILLLGEVAKAQTIRRFQALGIDESRIRALPRLSLLDYLSAHSDIDVALDPFPYNGGATSCHALWMGVPFVALEGDRYMSRMGLDLLHNAGLAQFIASDLQQYVRIAVSWASRRPELAEVRRTLRPRMEGSPLGDTKCFVRHLEDAYGEMWRAWCSDRAPGFSRRAPEPRVA
ncbi:MAG: glycosyltransferase family 41 protein [Betaproteobacteria bacterium]|nr:glycosyltransferase family 41 protein [Betaproteobacteria bacterium]